MEIKNYYLPAEWHPQSYIQLTWPHKDTDWAYMLEEVEKCFLEIATHIAQRQPCCLSRLSSCSIEILPIATTSVTYRVRPMIPGTRSWIYHLAPKRISSVAA